MHIIVLAAGKGSRFTKYADQQPQFAKPKPMIVVDGKSILRRTMESIPIELFARAKTINFAILDDEWAPQFETHIKKVMRDNILPALVPKVNVLRMADDQRGNLDTAYRVAIDLVKRLDGDPDPELLILDADNQWKSQYFDMWIDGALRENKRFTATVGFRSPPNEEPKWCYAQCYQTATGQYMVSGLYEKEIPPLVATARVFPMVGVFYFSCMSIFMKRAFERLQVPIEGEYYMSSVLKANDAPCYLYVTSEMTPLGTPEDVAELDSRLSVYPKSESQPTNQFPENLYSKAPPTYRICFDLDGTLCYTKKSLETYADVKPIPGAIEALRELKKQGHYIIIQTARHMRTCDGDVGKVIARQGKVTLDWLEKYDVPYDEIYFGKPHADFFVDDKGLRHNPWSEDFNYTMFKIYDRMKELDS